MRQWIMLLAILFSIAPMCFGQTSKPAELVNGDFSADADHDGVPDGWTRNGDGVLLQTEAGKSFVRLSAGQPGKLLQLSQSIDVTEADQAFEFSYRVRHDVTPGKRPWNDGRIILTFWQAEKTIKWHPEHPAFDGKSDGWVTKTQKFTVPKGAIKLVIDLTLMYPVKGVVDFDQLTLKSIPAEGVPETPQPDGTSPVVPPPAKMPPMLHVDGNRIKDASGKEVWLQGLALPSLEFSVEGDFIVQGIIVGVEDWHANVIRLPVHEDYWYGKGTKSFGKDITQTDGGATYRQVIDSAINACAARGAYLVLDLHRYRAANKEADQFWKDAAVKYKNNPAVIFELLNEPHSIGWDVWQNGGPVTDKKLNPKVTYENKEKLTAYTAIGMQQLVDDIRATGAKNIVIAGGLDWGYDLSGILTGHELKDNGGNGIVYSSHVYPWKTGWQKKFLDVAAKHPIFIGECGGEIKPMFPPPNRHEDPFTWSPDMIGCIQKYKLNWTAWSYHPRATPRVISDWYYTPTPFWGDFVKRGLAGEQFEMKKLR